MSGGLGTRRLADDSRWGAVEILDLVPALSTIAAERAIRLRATAMRESGTAHPGSPVAPVHDVRRVHDTVSVIAPDPDGVRVQDLLVAMETGTLALTQESLLDLAAAAVRAVAWLHDRPGSMAHGMLSPEHIVLGREGVITLTDAVFADALVTLHWNRERLWRECRLTMPASATLPQFDQRADVVQIGGVVLALLLQRPLRVADYVVIPDLIMEATSRFGAASALRGWLQQALHLHPKLTFATAGDASAHFSLAISEGNRPAARTRNVLRQVISGLAG